MVYWLFIIFWLPDEVGRPMFFSPLVRPSVGLSQEVEKMSNKTVLIKSRFFIIRIFFQLFFFSSFFVLNFFFQFFFFEKTNWKKILIIKATFFYKNRLDGNFWFLIFDIVSYRVIHGILVIYYFIPSHTLQTGAKANRAVKQGIR